MQKLTLIGIISYISNTIPPVIGLLYWRRLNISQRIAGLLICVLIAYELINGFLFLPEGRNNRILFSTYTIWEFSLVALAYSFAFTDPASRRRIRWLVVGFDVFAIIDIVFFLKPNDMNALARSVETLLLIGLALLYLRQLLDELRVQRLSRHPMFWLTVGVLVYFPGTLILFSAFNWFSANLPKDVQYDLWSLNYVANIVFNLFIATALWLPPDQPQPPTSAPS